MLPRYKGSFVWLKQNKSFSMTSNQTKSPYYRRYKPAVLFPLYFSFSPFDFQFEEESATFPANKT